MISNYAHCLIESQFDVKTEFSGVGQETEQRQVCDESEAYDGPTETKSSEI